MEPGADVGATDLGADLGAKIYDVELGFKTHAKVCQAEAPFIFFLLVLRFLLFPNRQIS